MMSGSATKFLILLLLAAGLLGACVHRQQPRELSNLQEPIVVVPRKEVTMVYVPQAQRMPAHLLITKTDRYQFLNKANLGAFKKELAINSLMHNASMVAQVERRGKVVREYQATKSAQSISNNNKNIWNAGRFKLSLVVPFIDAEEEVVVKTSYAWMDTRWHWPIFLEEAEPTRDARLTVDVPYGINMRFKAARLGEALEFVPQSQALENALWAQSDNRAGQGMRYIFDKSFGADNPSKKPASRLQLFFSFYSPAQNDSIVLFENWEAISGFIYSRIDRYDLPSNAIRDFVVKETTNKENELAKIVRVLSFLSHDIERRAALGSIQEQDAQPATRTFARRLGSALDIAILGKAMLSSIGIAADVVAVADPENNPTVSDFFSPALFDKVILAVFSGSQTLYFDPSQDFERFDQVPTNLQGQSALLIRKSAGQYFALPFEPAEKNQSAYFYDLKLTPEGRIEGSFSLELAGIRADEAKSLVATPLNALSASTLQSKLQGHDLVLRWQRASLNQDQGNDKNVNFTGTFSPRLLARDAGTNFLLPIKDIFEPVLLPLINSNQQSYSSLTTIDASVQLPEKFTVPELPLSLSIDQHGMSGRFLVTLEGGLLVFKGEAMISLPLNKAQNTGPLAIPEHQLAIVEMAAQPEAPRGANANNPPENS